MPLYTKGPVTNEQKDALDYEAPFGEYMGAMVEQGLRDLPTAQSQRVVQVEEADAPARPTIDDAFILAADPAAGFDTPTLIDRARQLRREDPASQAARMSKPDALAKAKASGVDINVPDRGLTPFAVALLINEAKERNRRAMIMERHQTGWGSVAGWGAYFGVQLLDPVNIGTAFVPVIGEARYADILRRSSQLAGGVGRTGARLGVGAAEGVVGSLLVEPMIYSNEQILNADYGMADSLLNVAFGGVLGGGLHAVGGGVADLYRARTGAAQPWAAPQVLEDVLAQEPVAPTTTMVTGRAGDVRIGDEYVPSQWAVVDAGDVRATMEKADNQFRDRGRVSSDEQVREIANNIDFRMLGESPVMDYGSPTLSRDGRIIGGNGRMAAIDMAYDIGKGGQYREAMLEVLDQLGIDAEAVRRMKKPALVRVLQKDVNVREAAILSNEGGAMRMSALEQAKVDAERMGDFLAFEVADDGNLATAGNRGFIRQWVDKYPKNQRNALVDADGMLSAEGLRRLQNGILFRAYGDSPTLTRLIEATDPGSRNIASAMTRAAAVAADARAEIAAGNMWDVDIADDLRAAVEKMDDLRRRGMSVQEFFDQMDAFGSGLTPEAEALLRYIGENIRSPRALAAVVSRYYDLLRQAGGPNQGDMFGGGAPVKGDLLDAAMRDARAATTAADVAEAATPQQRRAAMQASVAQAATGRSVDVEPIMTGGSRQDFMDAAERLDSPESVRVADFDAAAEVDQRAGQKSDVETALDEAMALAKDAAAGAKFSRGGARSVTDTPEFRAWSEDAPVVSAADASTYEFKTGQAAVVEVYHGTDVDLTQFGKDKIRSRFPYSIGFHFTNRTGEASIYADGLENAAVGFDPSSKFSKPPVDGGNVLPVYVRASNPLVIETDQSSASMEADMNRSEIIAQLVEAKRAGKPYDSVIIRRVRGDEYDGINVIVFEPTQIKSAFNRGTFDPSNPDIRYSRGDAAQTGGNWFYSPAMRALEGMKQAKGTAQQWISMLTKAPGVKKEEIEWTGVVDWLNSQKGSVSRDDVAAYLERTQVKLEEVTKGGGASADLRNLPFQAVEVDGEWNIRRPNGQLEYRPGSGLTRDQAEQYAYSYSSGFLSRGRGSLPQLPRGFVVRRATAEDVDDGLVDDDTVGRWALAVGDDDTVGEVNGTLMAESYAEAVVEAVNMLRDLGDEDFLADVVIPPSMPRWSSLTLPGGKNYTELLLKLNVPESARPFIHNAHWDDQQNVLAHIRFDEFERDGKRYLRVFEMQSDWHQSGRREGYKNGKRLKEVRQRLADLREIDGGKWTPELEAEETALIGERDRLTGAGVVPDAPFKTSWPELTLKRVIALAAEKGLDGVLWPDAALVPEIEKWGKTLDQIKSSPDDSKKFGAILDRYEVTLPRIAKDLTKKFGGKVGEVRVDNSQGRSLVDIAKEHSLEIWKSGDEIKFYSGDDVVDYDDLPRPVMRALDKLLENVADGDLSGVDIYAAIDGQDVATAERWHAVELDDRLRETVAGGLPLFARGDGDAAATPRDAVLATARQSFGDATDDLVAAGRIEVVDTVEDLPIPVPADVKGVELGGRVYLVASNLRPDEVRGVVLHEVGVHSGMRGLLGDDVFKQVLADVDARVAAGDKAFVEARERAIAYSNKPEHVREETVAYLVQNAPKLSWVQELLARLKAALYRVTRGKLFDLDEADLQMLAVAALRKAANDERVARMDAAAAFARGEVYHGSPYRFSKFSLEHMGRGEGAQAYGWGLYFAGKREVGEHYRKVLTARNLGDPFMVGGKRYESVKDAKADGVFTDAEIELIDDAELQDAISSLGVRDGLKTFHEAATKYGGDKAVADSIVSKITPDDTATGQLYRVEIPSDDQYLLWDKPLSEQSERVRAAVGALAEKYGYDYGDRTGGEAYRALTSDLNAEGMVGARADAQQAASELLNSLGIAGIKYLDGTSRVAYPFEVQVFGSSGALLKWEKFRTKSEADAFSAEQTAEGKKTNIIERASSDESFNYAIFDDAAIDIVETYYSRGGEQQKPAAPGDLNAELKPFDEAIKRAELYGTAVRAAAERLGDDEAARAAMATATGDKLLAAEVDDLLAMLKKENARVRASLRKARDQFTAEDAADALQDDAMRAAETVANNVKLAAEIEKRNAALNIAAKMRGIQFAQQFADKREGFMALLSGSAVAKNGSRLSAQAEQKAFLGRWTGGMVADLEKAGLWKLFVSDTMSRETMQALSALTSGVEPDAGLPKQAVAMARVVHKYLEDSRLVRNRFGAWIRDLRGYTVRQSHDMFKIRKAGYQAWRDFVLPRLDVERTLREFPDADVERFLQGAYNDFAAGIHMEYLKPEDVAPFKGPGNLAKRQSQSRVIYLKDAAAEHAYLEQFGVGRFSEAILQQLTAAANSAGMLKVLGTNPEANLEAMMDAVESQMVADPVARQKFHEQRKQILSLLGYLDGKANIPGNAMAARISANLRAWQSMAKLGGALLSSITDLAVYASEVKYQGRGGYLSGMSEAIGGLVQGRRGAERRQMLMSMGVFFDSMVGEVNRRFDADDLMGGTSSWLMQKFFKWNGLQWWTESLRMSSALSFSSHLAETAGKSWAKLGPDFQRVLGLYRIDEGKWDVLRMATLRESDGRRYLTPDGLDAVPDAALENYLVQAGRTVTPAAISNLRDDLRQALRSMIIDRGEHAIIEPDARTRWWLLRGQPPGTVWGETARFIAQFKGFPVAVLQRTLGREVYGRGSETLSQALRNGNGEMLGLVQLLAWMTLMGYGAMTAKDLLKGKAPRPVDDHRTWMAAMLQGGAAGIYGDFLFGEMRNRFGSGLLSTVAGPVIGTASDVADLWGRVRAGDDAAARAFRLLLQNTPFMNLFYTRIAMDYLFLYNLQEQMNPGYLRRMERRAEQENGQQWLLRPSEAAL